MPVIASEAVLDEWKDLVDWDALGAWMDERGLPPGALTPAERLPGGTQNLLVRFRRGADEYVLRRPARYPRPTSNSLILREARVLGALAGTDIPHPRLVAACSDEEVLGGVTFYVMEFVDGFNPTVELPAHLVPARHHLVLRATEELGRLARLDPFWLGLGDFGRPEGFLARQVQRWIREFQAFARLPNYPAETLPGMSEVAEFLTDNEPAQGRTALMHGDFHLGNLLFSPRGEVSAVLDWEMATLGDPLLDLGRFLATWPDEDDVFDTEGVIYGQGSLPAPETLAKRYADVSGADLSALDWYTAMACFKLGVILEGTHARACAGQADRRLGERMHRTACALLRRARRIAGC